MRGWICLAVSSSLPGWVSAAWSGLNSRVHDSSTRRLPIFCVVLLVARTWAKAHTCQLFPGRSSRAWVERPMRRAAIEDTQPGLHARPYCSYLHNNTNSFGRCLKIVVQPDAISSLWSIQACRTWVTASLTWSQVLSLGLDGWIIPKIIDFNAMQNLHMVRQIDSSLTWVCLRFEY